MNPKVIIPFITAFALVGCSYTTTSNTFSYHGTDLENTTEPFSYVQKNLVGSAETSYTWRGGGNTRNGLLADAFEDLNEQFKLDVNQTLANVAIDFMEIESGLRTPLLLAFFGGVSYDPSDYTTIVNIRADIIEFGLNSPWTLVESTSDDLPMNVAAHPAKGSTIVPSKAVGNDIINSDINSQPIGSAVFGTVQEGDSVKIFFKGDSHVGVVREITQSYGQILFRVEFDYNGKTKNRLFYDSQVIKFQLD